MVWKTNQCVFAPSPNDLWKQSNKKAARVYFGQSNRLIRASGWLVPSKAKKATKIRTRHKANVTTQGKGTCVSISETFLLMESLFSFHDHSSTVGLFSTCWVRISCFMFIHFPVTITLVSGCSLLSGVMITQLVSLVFCVKWLTGVALVLVRLLSSGLKADSSQTLALHHKSLWCAVCSVRTQMCPKMVQKHCFSDSSFPFFQ